MNKLLDFIKEFFDAKFFVISLLTIIVLCLADYFADVIKKKDCKKRAKKS